MFVCSIDVGIVNLAVVCVELHDASLDILRITYVANVNSTVFEHIAVDASVCSLGHTKTTTDRVRHFVQERRAMFDACTHVLIERQPLVGHTDVEQILFFMFRHKAVLVSPNAMHNYFKISKYSYITRKYKTVMLADHFLSVDHFPEYHLLERKHDIADALCLLLFWIHTQREASKRVPPSPPTRTVPPHSISETSTTETSTTTTFTSLMSTFIFKGRDTNK